MSGRLSTKNSIVFADESPKGNRKRRKPLSPILEENVGRRVTRSSSRPAVKKKESNPQAKRRFRLASVSSRVSEDSENETPLTTELVTSEKSVKRFKRDSECSDVSADVVESSPEVNDCFERLPEEIIYQVFSFLDDPRDLLRAAGVCARWWKVSRSPQFWRSLPLSSWQQGLWHWRPSDTEQLIEQNNDILSENLTNFYDDCQEHLKTIGKSSSSSVTF